jgi:hypothetical protein
MLSAPTPDGEGPAQAAPTAAPLTAAGGASDAIAPGKLHCGDAGKSKQCDLLYTHDTGGLDLNLMRSVARHSKELFTHQLAYGTIWSSYE